MHRGLAQARELQPRVSLRPLAVIGGERRAIGRFEIGGDRRPAIGIVDANPAGRLAIADRRRKRGQFEQRLQQSNPRVPRRPESAGRRAARPAVGRNAPETRRRKTAASAGEAAKSTWSSQQKFLGAPRDLATAALDRGPFPRNPQSVLALSGPRARRGALSDPAAVKQGFRLAPECVISGDDSIARWSRHGGLAAGPNMTLRPGRRPQS